MRVLFLNFYYAPDFSSDVPIVQGLAQEFAAQGHHVHLVVSAPHRQGGRIWSGFRGRMVRTEANGSMSVDRTWVYSRPGMGLAGRAINYLSYSALALPLLRRRPRPDVIFVATPPPNMGLTGLIASGLTGAPYVLNVQDIYPDVAIRAGILSRGRIASAFQRVEDGVYRRARRISVISESFRQNLLAKGVPSAKVEVVPNFVDTQVLTPLPRDTRLRRTLGLENRIIVLYAGSLGHPQGLDRVLEAAAVLRARTDLVFLFVGEGTKRSELEQLAKEWQLPNVRFLAPRPWSDVPEVLATADIALVPLRKGFAFETVPSKLYSIMASGRPVIAAVDQGSETWNLVEASGCGICIPPEDAGALAEAITSLASDGGRRGRLGAAGRDHVVEHYSKGRMARRYEAMFADIVEPWTKAER